MDKLEKNFGEIYDNNINQIYRFIYLKVNSQSIAEDLTSETFLKGWERFKNKSNKINNPRAFLYQIARNLVVDHYREKGRSQTVSVDSIPIIDTSNNIEEKAELDSEMEMIKCALGNINDEYREIVVLRHIEDFSISEISEALNKSEGAVRVMLHRAINSIKEEIDRKTQNHRES